MAVMLIHLFVILSTLCVNYVTSEKTESQASSWKLSPEVAHNFLAPADRIRDRVKRGIHEWRSGKEIARRARERIEAADEVERLHRELSCRRRCWQEWSTWSTCSGKCHSGIQTRGRQQKLPADCRGVPCPGDSQESHQCHMQCSPGGKVKDGACQCHLGYLGDCCTGRVTCPRPAKPENGNIGGIIEWPGLYNQVAVSTCTEGHVIIGSEQRRCQLNGTWSGTNPQCIRIECRSPNSPTDGALVNVKSTYVYGDTIGYRCNLGYELHGVPSRTCSRGKHGAQGKWTAFSPTCIITDCGNPGTPDNGTLSSDVFTYDSEVNFSCDKGFQLIGSENRKCLPTGSWSGKQPICKEIRCESVERPLHSIQSSRDNHVDAHVYFSCLSGYELQGDNVIRCSSNGTWNGTVPTCAAILCNDPGRPQHGARHDNGFQFGQNVTFTCFAGYLLEGAAEAVCREDRTWSNQLPSCTACPKDHYQHGERCERCPDNSHTVTQATASRELCLCNHGYKQSNDGECTEIICPVLQPPVNGKIVSCHRKLGQTCIIDCHDGYILSRGSSHRTCTDTGTWDGELGICEACPVNTYKADVGSCLPCPALSHTLATASSQDNCVCNSGYVKTTNGSCHDEDECILNDGRGRCEQGCQNLPGSFRCTCTIPGYKVDEENGHTCIPEKQCRNLTLNEVPDHGGLVCHWYYEENSQHCTVKCNPGYELPVRVNSYETCGPATGYRWSFRRVDVNATLNPCIEEFFPEFRFEGNSAYFVKECNQLTEADKDEVKREFARTLTDEGVCLKRRTRVCDMHNVGIICSRVRRKRGTEIREEDVIQFKFNIIAKKEQTMAKDCDQICPMLRIPAQYCDRYCLKAYKRFLRAAVMFARRQVSHLYQGRNRNLSFRAAQREFQPNYNDVSVSDIIVDCQPGMKTEDGMCVPCPAGTHYNHTQNECQPCQPGTFQPMAMQTLCLSCPVGQTTINEGSKTCQACPDGTFGMGCKQTCQCNHGSCDSHTGQCVCESGWQGALCDTDIQGCSSHSCSHNITCLDIAAPGTGYQCGACPSGYNSHVTAGVSRCIFQQI